MNTSIGLWETTTVWPFEGRTPQIPTTGGRMHYVKVKVRVHRYGDGSLVMFHGPRKLAEYDAEPGVDQPRIQAVA